MWSQEKLLDRIRVREQGEQTRLRQENPETAKRRQHALDRIAACVQDGAELSQAHFFLESAQAFETHLFSHARCLLRLADESAKPDGERLPGYRRSEQQDVTSLVLEPKTIIKELEVAKLAESLGLWVRYAGADAELAAKVLDGKTPQERAAPSSRVRGSIAWKCARPLSGEAARRSRNPRTPCSPWPVLLLPAAANSVRKWTKLSRSPVARPMPC